MPIENQKVGAVNAYKAQMKSFKSDMKLTDERAMLLYTLYNFEMFDEHANLVIANKLCYFYQQVGEESFGRMRFSRGHYGPYCHQVEYLLKSVTGKYIHGLEEMDAKPFEDLDLEYGFKQEVSDYVHKMPDAQRRHIREVLNLIDGFESAFSLEILATVSYIMQASPNISFEDVVLEVGKWSERKNDFLRKTISALHITVS